MNSVESKNEDEMERLKKENDFLFKRVDYLEQVNAKHRNVVRMLSELGEVYETKQNQSDSKNILKIAQNYIKQLTNFDVSAFFLVDEDDSSFFLADCDLKQAEFDVEELKDNLIERGEFAWALSQNRAVVVENGDKKVFLHILSTKKRTRGLFLGVCTENELPTSDTEGLLSIVFQNTAYTLESTTLYRMVNHYNQQLHKTNEQLELKVTERTQQLMSAVKDAEKANSSKSQFLANMSHEIRTPMNAIINLSQLALEGELSAEQQDNISKVVLSSQHLLAIINDILDFSKIEAGKLDIELINFDLKRLLADLHGFFELCVKEKDLQLVFDLSTELPKTLKGDPVRIKQILTNLINNAIKFTAVGSVTLSVQQIKKDAESVSLSFSVKDTGIGIKEEQRHKLFQSFNQVDSSTSRQFGGTGLGLAISKQLVELMGGSIGLESKAEQGSTFSFTLKFIKVEEEVLLESNKVVDYKECLKDKVVLLAEDNKINQMVGVKLLKRTGCTIEIANNGVETFEMVKQNPEKFDLILMDLQMPKMDGYESTTKIREIMDSTQLPIIAMTADAMEGVKENCLSVGMNDYVSKPIDFKDLVSTILKSI